MGRMEMRYALRLKGTSTHFLSRRILTHLGGKTSKILSLSVDVMKAVNLLSHNTERYQFFASFSFEEDCSGKLTGTVRYRKRCVHVGKHPLAMVGSSTLCTDNGSRSR